MQPILLAVLAVLLLLWFYFPKLTKKAAGEIPAVPEKKAKKWLNIDFDLVETGRRTINKTHGG